MIKLENLLIAIYGITTVAVFGIMIYFGGLFDSIHTLLFREISFLISPYSLHENSTVPLYRLYNVNLLLFSIILGLRMRHIFSKLGALYLSMSAVSGLLLVEFPMDAIQLSRSVSGMSHIVVTLVTAVYLIIAMLLFTYSFKRSKQLAMLADYSFGVCIVILCAGFLTGVFALFSMPEYVGFVQKLPIAAFLTWILVTAVWTLRSDKRVNYAPQFTRKK